DERRVSDGEPAHLGPAAVVPGDGLHRDGAVGVGDELGAGGGEVPQVVADRGENRLGRLRCAAPATSTNLVADEGDPLTLPLELRRGHYDRARFAQAVGERF